MTTFDKIHLMRPNSANSLNRVKAVNPAATGPDRQSVAGNGKELPSNNAADVVTNIQQEELDAAVKDVSGYVQNISRELNFSVDAELDKTVITVIDEETGDVVRQIPTEDILEMAKNIAQLQDSSGGKGILFQGDA